METLFRLLVAHSFKCGKNLFKMKCLLCTNNIDGSLHVEIVKFLPCEGQIFGGIKCITIRFQQHEKTESFFIKIDSNRTFRFLKYSIFFPFNYNFPAFFIHLRFIEEMIKFYIKPLIDFMKVLQ